MAQTIQGVVDGLSRRVGRPVLVDDRHGRLVAYSSQRGVVDAVRTSTIMNRETPPEVTAWIRRFSITRADRPYLRIPENPELEMLARVCFPIRSMDALLGSVWLIEAGQRLNTAELAAAEEAADSVRTLLHRELLLDELSRSRERELLRDVLADRESIRAQAADGLHEMDVFRTSDKVAVYVCRQLPADHQPMDERTRLGASAELDRLRGSLSPARMSYLIRGEHCVVFCAVKDRPPRGLEQAVELAQRLHQRLELALGTEMVIGIGGIGPLVQAGLHHRRALQALEVAQVVPNFRPTPAWWRLGIYRLLLKVPAEELGIEDLHPGLARLLLNERAEVLVRTLECYLDNSGDAPLTAKELFVARGSLYHRLKRIEQVADINLRNGEERLDIHLSLKVARLRGFDAQPGSQSRTAGTSTELTSPR